MASSSPTLSCDTCTNTDSSPVVGMCPECKELYCLECLQMHKIIDVTKNHAVIGFDNLEFKTTSPYCFYCFDLGKGRKPPTDMCLDCRCLLCDICKQRHLNFKATKDHKLHEILKNFAYTETVSVDSVNLSSDFDTFTLTGTGEGRGAQAPVSSLRNRKQPTQQQHRQKLTETDMDKIHVKVTSPFSGKVKEDKKDCSLKGILCWRDGGLLVLDFDNKNLKMFDNNYHIICTELMKVQGSGMTKVSDHEIAVVSEQSVCFYTVTNNRFVLQDKVFNLGAVGYKISYKRYKYAISCNIRIEEKDSLIMICSSTGQEINHITSFKYKPSQFITLDKETDRLYVSPYYTIGKFICLSLQGQLLWEMDLYSTEVAELYNCLLVTSYNDNIIYLCNKDGTYRITLIKDKERLNKVAFIAYNPVTQQIFVTRSYKSIKKNDITVVQLSF